MVTDSLYMSGLGPVLVQNSTIYSHAHSVLLHMCICIEEID